MTAVGAAFCAVELPIRFVLGAPRQDRLREDVVKDLEARGIALLDRAEDPEIR